MNVFDGNPDQECFRHPTETEKGWSNGQRIDVFPGLVRISLLLHCSFPPGITNVMRAMTSSIGDSGSKSFNLKSVLEFQTAGSIKVARVLKKSTYSVVQVVVPSCSLLSIQNV